MNVQLNTTSGVILLGFIYSVDERGAIIPILVFFLFLGFSANGLIIFIVYSKSYLITPKNILICNLCAVDLYGITTTCPYLIIRFILGDLSPMDMKLCLLQYYFYVTYSCLSVFIVTLMAVDRYYVICNPFEYEMTITNTKAVLSCGISWLFAIFYPMIYSFPYIGHESCRLVLSPSFMCTGISLEESMCISTTFQGVFRMFMFTIHLLACLAMVGFSYVKILMESRSARLTESSRKALNTVVTHSIVLAIFFVSSSLLIVTGSLHADNGKAVIAILRIATDLIYFNVPTTFNPIIYGLRNEDIRKEFLKIFKRNKSQALHSIMNSKTNNLFESEKISHLLEAVGKRQQFCPLPAPVIKVMPYPGT